MPTQNTQNKQLKGKRVRLVTTTIQVEVEAVVEAEEDNGVVLRLDPSTFRPIRTEEDDEFRKTLVKRYFKGTLNLDDAEDPLLQWLGRAHVDNLTVID